MLNVAGAMENIKDVIQKIKNRPGQTSGQDDRHSSPLHTTIPKLQLKYRKPSLRTIRNRVEWKSDNYKIKETTSIETGRRGADMDWGGPTSTCREQKFGRDISGARGPNPKSDCQSKVPMPGKLVPTTSS